MTDDFHGLAVRTLENEHLRLDYLIEAGPRIVRLFRGNSSENLFADVYGMTVPTPFGDYSFLGGHRLWLAPEAFPRTYFPDMNAITVHTLPDGVSLTAPTEPKTGITKSIEIHLHRDQPAVTLHHELRNDGPQPVELAPWAITQLKLGGVAILPQPGGERDKLSPAPNRNFVFWHYSSTKDTRLSLSDEIVFLRGEPGKQAFKMGCTNLLGWVAYWRAGVLFVKRFELTPGLTYPDSGSNTELFCGDRFIELESLGPLSVLQPEHSVRHTETWELHDHWDIPLIPGNIREILRTELEKVL